MISSYTDSNAESYDEEFPTTGSVSFEHENAVYVANMFAPTAPVFMSEEEKRMVEEVLWSHMPHPARIVRLESSLPRQPRNPDFRLHPLDFRRLEGRDMDVVDWGVFRPGNLRVDGKEVDLLLLDLLSL